MSESSNNKPVSSRVPTEVKRTKVYVDFSMDFPGENLSCPGEEEKEIQPLYQLGYQLRGPINI